MNWLLLGLFHFAKKQNKKQNKKQQQQKSTTNKRRCVLTFNHCFHFLTYLSIINVSDSQLVNQQKGAWSMQSGLAVNL
jgi:hypothetical protein